MKPFTLERSQILPVSQDEAWRFFTDPANLGRITPPSMEFRLTCQPQCRATGLWRQTTCVQFVQLRRGQRFYERGQWQGILGSLEATTEHGVELLLFEQRR